MSINYFFDLNKIHLRKVNRGKYLYRLVYGII